MYYKHFVTIGHLDHGKSSTIGALLWQLGKVGEQTKTYLKEIGGAENRQFAYVLDSSNEERGRGITINVGHNKLLVGEHSFTFSDAPGHDVFIDKAYQGIDDSDGAIVVVAADEGIKEQTKKHVDRCQAKKMTDFIVCVNKMDAVNYDQARYEKLRQEMTDLVGDEDTIVIPTSAVALKNISERATEMPWYEGPTLLDAIKAVPAKENSIDELVDQTKQVMQQAYDTFKNPVMLWAGGKDSTTEISIARELFGDPLPFPVLFINTTWKFAETYEYMNHYAKEWKLDFRVVKNQEALERGINPWSVSHFEYCNEMKTKPLKQAIIDNKFDAVFTGIRWDEHGIRGKEQYFSERTDPPHTRVHPILHWSEAEIWEYLKSREVPYNPLYDKEEHNGMVYRSIGCWPFTKPVAKDEPEERAGRELDKERLMEDLRSLGYM